MTKKALSLTEFVALPADAQLKTLQKNGVYVGKRKNGQMITVLFQLNAFYVEVFYIKYRRVVDRLVTSDDPDMLTPYIDQVQVSGLRNLNKDGE